MTDIQAGDVVARAHRPHYRPPPDDFHEHAPKLTLYGAKQRWRTSGKKVADWYKTTGIAPLKSMIRYRPPPVDFAELAPQHSISELRAHYKVGNRRIYTWLKDAGVSFRRMTQSEAARVRWGPPKPKPPKKRHLLPSPRVTPLPEKDARPDALAADHLRKWGPVYRCDDRGRADYKGKLWRCGILLLTAEQLIERAQQKGWEPFELRRAA